jgi:hypothetical protein
MYFPKIYKPFLTIAVMTELGGLLSVVDMDNQNLQIKKLRKNLTI